MPGFYIELSRRIVGISMMFVFVLAWVCCICVRVACLCFCAAGFAGFYDFVIHLAVVVCFGPDARTKGPCQSCLAQGVAETVERLKVLLRETFTEAKGHDGGWTFST